jgi:amino acid transporter
MSSSRPDTVSAVLTRGRLGTLAVVFFVVSAAAPLTAVAGGATTGWAVTRVLGIPLAYLAVALILGLFAFGYVAMSRRISNAGAFYSFIARGLGRPAGVAAALVALVGYNAMQIGLYGVFGAVTSGFVNAQFGWHTTWWVCAFAACAVIAVLGVLHIDFTGRVLAVLLTAECLIVVVYDLVMLSHPADGLPLDTLNPGNLFGSGLGAALVTGVAGFVGFEATTVYSEETKDPRRTVARATYIALGITGLLYALSGWAMSVATGPGHIVEAAQGQGTDLMFNLVSPHLTSSLVTLGRWLFITSLFAALLSFHHTVARYSFALGRERVLPAVLGRTSWRTGAPRAGSLSQTALAVAVLAGYVLADADPIVHLFFWLTSMGALGVLILMTVTSVAVVAFFTRTVHSDGWWRTTVAPSLSALALGTILVITVRQFDALLGVAPTNPLRWLFPASYLAAAILGAAWALTLRATRPDVYQAIGLGADSVSAPLRAPHPVRQPV